MSTCTCHPCGRSFTGLTAFDKHQDVDNDRRTVTCQDPETLGMVQNAHGRWGFPMDDSRREQLAAIRGSAETAPGSLPPQNLSAEHDQARVTG